MAHIAKQKTISSLERGLLLLELMSEREEVKLAELPEMLGSSRATAFRLLAVLQERGYVVHNKERRSYSLGVQAAVLAARSHTTALLRAAEGPLEELRRSTLETINLAILQGTSLFYVRILDGLHALRMTDNVGEAAPIHATALGKAVLAAMPEERHSAYLGPEPFERFTPATPTTLKELEREISAARKAGYAVDNEGIDSGAASIGAAISPSSGKPIGGISLSGAAARLTPERRAEFGEAVASAAAEISEAMTSPVEAATVGPRRR
jgi:DNA-binding IclR family transcriptional regulator